MENLNKLFDKFVSEEVITDSAKSELSVVFEAAVNEKVNLLLEEKTKAIRNEYDSRFEVVVEEHNKTTRKQLNDYLKHCAQEFVAENKVAIQNTIVVEKAKAILDGIQAVFEQHGIKLPEGNTQIVTEMNSKVNKLQGDYNKVVNKNIKLETALEEAEKAVIFMKNTSDLSVIAKEKLINLMNGLVVESVDEFAKKLSILKENVVTEKKKGKKKVAKEEDEDGEKKPEDEMKPEDEVEDKVDREDDDEEDEEEVAKEQREKINGYLRNLKNVRM